MSKGQITITKMNGVEETVRVSIRTEEGTTQAEMSMEVFSDALFGKVERPCEIRIRKGVHNSVKAERL